MKKNLLILPLAPVIFAGCLPTVSCSIHAAQTKFEIMHDDYRDMLINCINTSAYDQMSVEEIKGLLTEVVVTGALEEDTKAYKFNDLDYDSTDQAWWPPHQHLRRTAVLAVLGAKKNNTEITNIAVKLLCFWLGNEFINPGNNWWFGMIGVPQELTNIGLFILDNIPEKGKTKFFNDLRKGTFKYGEGTRTQTGTNLFWCADISLKSGIFDKDDEQINEVTQLVRSEIVMHHGDAEGFQDDGTYYQHGNQLYNGGYGRQGVLTICRMLAAFTRTGMPLTNEQIDIVDTFPLDGMKYFTHKGYVNYQTMGRTYTRKESGLVTAGATDLGNILEFKTLSTFDHCPRRDDLNKLLNSWQNNESTFTGIKYFPRSCMLTMNIDNVYMSFKGTNNTLINTEKANSENFLGYNLSYGTSTCVMSTGQEYFDIAPVWQYDSIPGTTALTENDEQLKIHTDFGAKLQGTFNGGYDATNKIAYSMQKTSKDNNHFTVTCIGTGDGMILIGSGLTNDNSEPLHTTVEQCIAQDSVFTSYDKTQVLHGNVLYTNLEDGSKFDTFVGDVEGDWSRNNTSQTGSVTKRMLKITIDDANQSKYAYCIQPFSKRDMKFKVISNTEANHAILLPGNKIAAAFYTESEFIYEGTRYAGGNNEFKIFDVI